MWARSSLWAVWAVVYLVLVHIKWDRIYSLCVISVNTKLKHIMSVYTPHGGRHYKKTRIWINLVESATIFFFRQCNIVWLFMNVEKELKYVVCHISRPKIGLLTTLHKLSLSDKSLEELFLQIRFVRVLQIIGTWVYMHPTLFHLLMMWIFYIT